MEIHIQPDMILAGIQALREEKEREASERDTVLAVFCAMSSVLAMQEVYHQSRMRN